MPIREIRLANVRSYDLYAAPLDAGVTLVLGPNGTGKTTILEGLYYLAQGTSFRGRDRDMLAHGGTRAELATTDTNNQTRRATLQQLSDDTLKKSFIIDSRTSARLPAKARQPVVLFEPDELRLLSSSPERRRSFFDGILARLYPQYATVLSRYQRVLLQRNELLKQHTEIPPSSWSDQLFVWDIKFAELATTITTMRREFVVTSKTHLSRLYSQLAHAEHRIGVKYLSSIAPEHYQQQLLNRLQSTHQSDAYRGYTTSGPHRDDITITLEGHPASETASRGEMRTIMLAYKLLEVELQHEAYAVAPLILMDDVFSELDPTREQRLMHALVDYQTIITATDLRDELKINASIISLA